MPRETSFRYLCCYNLTIAARMVGLIGVVVSILLATILLHDKYEGNFDSSRKIALALGLDWQHFHPQANATQQADPNGKFISIIVIVYAYLFAFTSMLLIFATITCKRWYVVPWLVCEAFGCLSKLSALIFHLTTDPQHFSFLFIGGSTIYVVLCCWWMLLVFGAQSTWKSRQNFLLNLNFTPNHLPYINKRFEYMTSPRRCNRNIITMSENSPLDSPVPYYPNNFYTRI